MRPPRLLIVFLLVAAALGGWFATRPPVVKAVTSPIDFAPGPLGGDFTAKFTNGEVALGTDLGTCACAALVRKDGRVFQAAMDTHFLAVEQRGHRVWALSEFESVWEDRIDATFELLVSDDDGATFERRSVPKPAPVANFESWRIDGDVVELTVVVDDQPLARPWWRPYTRALAAVTRTLVGRQKGPGCPARGVMSSRDAGKSWRLQAQ